MDKKEGGMMKRGVVDSDIALPEYGCLIKVKTSLSLSVYPHLSSSSMAFQGQWNGGGVTLDRGS